MQTFHCDPQTAKPEPLPHYTFPGCYPLFYWVDGQILCPDCALNWDATIDDAHINYDSALFCDDCNAIIDQAYGG